MATQVARSHSARIFMRTEKFDCENAWEVLLGMPDYAFVFFSHVAHFHISECVNKRYWNINNPR